MIATREGERMARRIWTVDALLMTWGAHYEYGRLSNLAAVTQFEASGMSGRDEGHLVALYVEGLLPPCRALTNAFLASKPALVHVYAKLGKPETFDVPLLPGQSELSRKIVCNLMVSDYRDVLEAQVKVQPFDPSYFESA